MLLLTCISCSSFHRIRRCPILFPSFDSGTAQCLTAHTLRNVIGRHRPVPWTPSLGTMCGDKHSSLECLKFIIEPFKFITQTRPLHRAVRFTAIDSKKTSLVFFLCNISSLLLAFCNSVTWDRQVRWPQSNKYYSLLTAIPPRKNAETRTFLIPHHVNSLKTSNACHMIMQLRCVGLRLPLHSVEVFTPKITVYNVTTPIIDKERVSGPAAFVSHPCHQIRYLKLSLLSLSPSPSAAPHSSSKIAQLLRLLVDRLDVLFLF